MAGGITKETKKRMGKGIIMPGLVLLFCGILWLGAGKNVRAEERQLTIYQGDMVEGENEYDNVTEIEHFFPGDTGTLKPYSWNDELWSSTEIVWTYTSSAPEVVAIDNSGSYQVMNGGYASVTVEGKYLDGTGAFYGQYEFLCCADVSGASLNKSSATAYIINYRSKDIEVAFSHLPDLKYYTFSCMTSDDSLNTSCTFDREKKCLVFSSGWTSGTETLTIVLNNKEFTFKLTTRQVSINKISAVLAKKKTTTIKLKGYSGKVKWKSTKKKTVSVSSKGVIRGKKTGNAVVFAEIDGERLGCAVSVVTPKRKKVINAAKKIAQGTYSQAKRMSKGYYDCSSLVWRAYQKEGKSFGSSGYAPVAADLCKYLFQRGKKIKGGLSTSNIQKMKLRPGDLMFETGANNGRYKGIYHVEMFVGYQCEGFDSNGKAIVGTLWAARGANYYIGCPMGRP